MFLTTTGPRLLAHDGIVAQHLGNCGPAWQQSEFVGSPRLERLAVLDNGRTDGDGREFRTDRRAAAG